MDIEKQKLQTRVEELSSEALRLAHTVTDLKAKLKLATTPASAGEHAPCYYDTDRNRRTGPDRRAAPQVDAVQAVPTVAWLIEWTGPDGTKYSEIVRHNAVGDYYYVDENATATELVRRVASPSPAVPPKLVGAVIVEAGEWLADGLLKFESLPDGRYMIYAAQPTDTTAGE